MFALLKKIFLKMIGGSRNERIIRARMGLVRDEIAPADDALRGEYEGLCRAAAGDGDGDAFVAAAWRREVAPLAARDWLRGKTAGFRRRLADGEPAARLLGEAFAAVRFASWLARDHRQFDVQMAAGQLLYESWIAEEATGEGKTIACYPAVYMAVLAGMKAHVVTTNDYLVQRDRDFAAPIFSLLDVTVGAIQQPMRAAERQAEYACDVIYGTNSEFGFDYLRDNMKLAVAEQALQGRQDYAIVDEVDNILIDEARTPLIISGPAYGDVDRYRKSDAVIRKIIAMHKPHEQADRQLQAAQREVRALTGELSKGGSKGSERTRKKLEEAEARRDRLEARLEEMTKYYEVELDKKAAHLTHEGITAAQDEAGIGSFYVGANMEWPHLLDQALRAHVVYERDKDYVVRGRDVVIVDEFTGRLMEGREWSDGLHQAVEAKERVPVKEENQTLATITLQNLFKLYRKLAGMTGTAMTEAEEFMKIYELDVAVVPTHRPVNRVDHDDRIYRSVEEKFDALVEEINEYSKAGRPILVGTTSIEKSEKLATMLTRRYGIAHEVLNGRPENAAREAEIVDLAGRRQPLKKSSKQMVGNVTIATNMAGRGTDIKLGEGVVHPKCKVPTDAELAEMGLAGQELYPAGTTKCCIHCAEYDPATNCAHCFKPRLDPDFPARGRGDCREVVPCGLHIVGTERHEARRIDNQLRGRAGRQGDPGSSRFFLSLRDDLLAVFAGEWTIKVLGWLGMEEGEPIEHTRISKGIERAQKKVEQRNFDMRKHLLEMDEVMDHQRKYFYSRRQRVLEGEGIADTVGDMIRGTVADAVADYLSGDYPQRCIAEWARVNLELNVPADRISGRTMEEFEIIEADLRGRACDEAANTITMTMGEYVDPDAGPKEWDLKGLSAWAMSRFGVNLSQNQLRKMDPSEMEAALVAGARERLGEADLSPIQAYLRDDLPSAALAEWARAKFGVTLEPEALPENDPPAAEAHVLEAVESAYRQRQIDYAVELYLDRTIGRLGVENANALKALADWANGKFAAGWTVEGLTGKGPARIHRDLTALSEQFVVGDALDRTVDAFLSGAGRGGDPRAVADFARQRFDTEIDPADLDGRDARDVLLETGRAFLRRELTELERFVLLQIYDTTWKDHLLAMDHLKGGIGLRGFAEQDPKIVYKKEGFRQFEEMLRSVREKVTDIVFKARLTGDAEMANVYEAAQFVHEQLSGYDHLAREMAAQQAAAEPRRIEQIVRDQPKVGRNDPCPCGSGKKFKKCCGRNV